MSYTKTTWINNQAPAINADNLNHIEQGIESAHTQIDQIIAPTGEAPNPAEIENARIGDDGIVYNTLGNAIRTQFSNVKSDFNVYQEDFVGVVNPIDSISWTEGKAISSNGSITDNGSFHYSSLMPVKSGTYTFIWEAVGGSNTIRVHGYDSNGTWVQQIDTFASGVSGVQTKVLDAVPSTVTQVRLSIGIKHKPLALYTGDTIQAQVNKASKMFDLVVCGYDATPYQKAIGEAMALQGYGYVCNSTELDSGINTFIDSFMNTERTIYFFGTIRTSAGIHKHPKHNLYGYDCTLKMGDSLGTDYVSCIFPTNGGVAFSSSQIISHNNTFIKGFKLDGNCENNKEDDVYKFKSIYGCAISPEIYNVETAPYSETQLCSDIVLEDITAVNTMRGIVAGIHWTCKNLWIGDSVTDHALYLAGASETSVENVYITGYHKNGAISISSASYDVSRKVRNIHLKNITLNECNGYPHLDIRGHFTADQNNQTLDDIFIDGFFIKRTNTNIEGVCIVVGTDGASERGTMGYDNYPMNVNISNLVADVKLYNRFMIIQNAGVKLINPTIRATRARSDRSIFQIQSNQYIQNAILIKGMRLRFDIEEPETPITVFGIYNTRDDHNVLDGFVIEDSVIYGIDNYYMFGSVDGTVNTKTFTINDFVFSRLIASPYALMNPSVSSYVIIGENNYYELT